MKKEGQIKKEKDRYGTVLKRWKEAQQKRDRENGKETGM